MQSCEAMIQDVVDRIAGGTLPPHFQTVTDNRLATMDRLIQQMRSSDVSESVIQSSISQLAESFEAELVKAVDQAGAGLQ